MATSVAMTNVRVLASLPCPRVLHEDVGGHVTHLPHDVQLAQPVEAFALIGDGIELRAAVLRHLPDRMQPVVDLQ
jgi:hypothetical protein